MKHEDFSMKTDGFVGHSAEPDGGSDTLRPYEARMYLLGGN